MKPMYTDNWLQSIRGWIEVAVVTLTECKTENENAERISLECTPVIQILIS